MHDRDDPPGGSDVSPRRSPRTGATNDEAAEDAALVRLARAGDEGAFGALVVLGDVEEAEDAVQDAFVAALKRLEDCRPEEKFRPWLLTIVRNRAIDLRRRQRVRRAESLDVLGETVAAPPGLGPLRDAERADVRAHLERALATLTDVRREVVLLHDLEGWSHREIGTHLGLAEGTVRAHLFWARRDLRRRLSAEWRRDDDEE